MSSTISSCFHALSLLNPLIRRPTLDALAPESAFAEERHRRVLLTSLTFAAYRGLSLLFPILTIGFFLHGLGREIYGLWMTVTSFFALFSFADLGLGFGLLTRLSQAHGQGDNSLSRRLISSTFFMLSGVSGLLLLLILTIFPFLPWGMVLNATSSSTQHAASWIVWSVVIAQLLQIPLSLVQRTQLALQEGYKSNLWQSGGVGLNLLLVFILVRVHAQPLVLVVSACIVPVLAILLNAIHFFGVDTPSLRPSLSQVDVPLAKSLLAMGGGFFVLQVLLSLGPSLDNLVVANTLGLAGVVDFAVASRVAAVIGGVVSMLSMPMWAANGDAIARGDFAWIRRSCMKLAVLSLALTLGASLLLVSIGPWLFEHWLGKSLHVGRPLLLYCALRESLRATTAPFFMVLNAAGIVKPQIQLFAGYTVLVTLLKVFLAKFMGSEGVALAGVLLYCFWVLPWVIRKARLTWGDGNQSIAHT